MVHVARKAATAKTIQKRGRPWKASTTDHHESAPKRTSKAYPRAVFEYEMWDGWSAIHHAATIPATGEPRAAVARPAIIGIVTTPATKAGARNTHS
jgi:hypothetical protein